MPIYEYRCARCGRVSQFLVRNIASHTTPACPRCGAAEMRRVISRVTVIGGRKGARADAPAPPDDDSSAAAAAPETEADAGEAAEEGGFEPSEADVARMEALLNNMDENDPRSIGRAMREMAAIAREPLEGEMEEVVRRLESGEDPDKIEEKMGDALGDADGGGDELYDG
ncbi:MAG: zinc ribbon domain-containing protein [Kiritimatiellae bacterium]|nr:zinc ribbon domain-containing protein [Kiritimatiellia bacterium]